MARREDPKSSRIRAITALGQSLWVDDLNRELLRSGRLSDLIDEGVTGVTSNPSIFERGMGHSDAYDDAFAAAADDAVDAQALFESLAYEDVRDAADLLAPTFERRGGRDGFVSFELPASMAPDAEASVAAAQRHFAAIGRPNVLIKVPGTDAGVKAFERLTALGVNVNVTLLFAVPRYEEIAEAYLSGLESRLADRQEVDGAASVASFFVSRVDTKVDAALAEAGRADLAGRAAIANARLAYRSFQRIFSGARWERIAAAGANPQRPLWGSTSTKNPNFPDTYYVDALIGPDTVDTMPLETLAAVRREATAESTVTRDIEAGERLLDEVRSLGIDFDHIVAVELVEEGLASFGSAYGGLLDNLAKKAAALGKRL